LCIGVVCSIRRLRIQTARGQSTRSAHEQSRPLSIGAPLALLWTAGCSYTPSKAKSDNALNDTLFRVAFSPVYSYLIAPGEDATAPDPTKFINGRGRLSTEYSKLSPFQKLKYRYETAYLGSVAELEKKTASTTAPNAV